MTDPTVKAATITVDLQYEDGEGQTVVWEMDPSGFHLSEYRGAVPVYEEREPDKVGHVLPVPERYVVIHGKTKQEKRS